MRTLKDFGWIVVALLVVLFAVWGPKAKAQGTRYQGCTPTTAVSTAGAAVTLTLTPPVGQFVYLCSWDVTVSNNNTGTVITNKQVTSTNLGATSGIGSSGSTWSWTFSNASAASNQVAGTFGFQGGMPIKSAAATTPVTIVCPAMSNYICSVSAYYYFGE